LKLKNDEILLLITEACLSIRPISFLQDGGRPRFSGSATLLQHGQSAYLFTAEHVLQGVRSARVGIPNDTPVGILPDFGVIRSRSASVKDPDVAFVGLGIDSKLRGSDARILEYQRGVSLSDPFSPQQYFAAGVPASRVKVRIPHDYLNAELMVGAFEAKAPKWYADNGIDPTTHIAVTYQRNAVTTPDGDPIFGSDPHGMSGGPLLVVAESEGTRRLYPVGILTEYRENQEHALLGVRLHPVIDCLIQNSVGSQSPFFASTSMAHPAQS
jgi:hypothetical protein